jgi:integrase
MRGSFGEALKSREHQRPQDNDGNTSEDPLQELLKRFEVASKVILNGVHTAPTRLRWVHPGDFARDSLTRPWLSRLRTVASLGKLRTVEVREGPFSMAKSHLKLVAPTEVNRTVAPTRRPNAELRTREHLTPGEVEVLVEAAKANRHGHRDATMILLAFRHGLRAAELCDLRWDQVEFGAAVLHVRRVKNGTPSTHPLRGDELRALRRLQRESETSPFVFVSERGSPFTTAGFARMIERAAASAGLDLKAHPHMLRHACGYALANKGHDTRAIQAWLGHRSITSTAIYTALAPNRFKDFWRD